MKKTKSRPATTKGTARVVRAAVKAPAAKPGATTRPAVKPAAKTAAPKRDEAAEMAAWQKAMTPSAGHARLEPLVGTFTARTTIWMDPQAPPQVSEGVSEHRWVLGDRWLEQSYKGNVMDMAFEGLGYTGYDNVGRKYQATWMDTCSTGIMVSESIGKPSDRQIQFQGAFSDPCGSGSVQCRTVVKIQDRDHHSFEMFRSLPGGKEFRSLLCEYTRK